jgi:hypothetical protein
MWMDMSPVWLERPGSGNPGVLLYVHRDDIQRFHLTVRLHGGANVVNLPIVRSADYRRGPTRLFPIEESGEKRVNVRIYGKPETTSEFRVRVVRAAGGGSYFETAVSLQTDDDRAHFEGTLVPVRPSYAEIPLPHIPTLHGTGTPFVEVLPADDTFAYWPMVTLTDNVTQAVEIFTPSP